MRSRYEQAQERRRRAYWRRFRREASKVVGLALCACALVALAWFLAVLVGGGAL